MKKIYTLLVVVLCFSANAQIVTIPDSVFKSDLINYNGVDTNNDGEIQVSEAQAITFIQIISSSIASFEGIQSFTNLEIFSILLGNSNATTMDLSALTQLTNLDIPSCSALTNIALNAPALAVLKIPNGALTSINLTSCTSLQTIDLSYNQIATIQMPNDLSNTLYLVDLSHNQLTSFSSPPTNLGYLNLNFNQLATFDFSFNPSDAYFTELFLNNNLLTSINFSALNHNIGTFDISNNLFTSLDFTGLFGGDILICSNNPNLTSVKFHAENNFLDTYINECPNLVLADFKNNSCDACFGLSGIACPYPGTRKWHIDNPNVTFCVDELVCSVYNDSERTEAFYFSHFNIILGDAVIPTATPATNLIATNCSLNTIPFEVVDDFNLYPNPAANTLNINLKDAITVKSITIYNTIGQLVMSIPNAIATDTIALDISNLKAGVYFVSVATDKGKTTQRFVKK